jgi:uncharacterized protein YraI
MRHLVMFVAWIGAAGAVMAGSVRMTGDDIKRAMLPGALLEIDTPLHISIPVKVSTNGIVSAEAGALGLTLGATKDRGRWWTEGDKLCMKWFRWFDAKPRCMALQRDGNKVYWQEGSGENGTATLTEVTQVAASESKPAPRDPKAAPTNMEATAPTAADASEKSQVRFATVALNYVIAPTKPVERPPVSKLGAGASSVDARVAEHAKPATASPLPTRSDQSKARARVARRPKVPAVATPQSLQSAEATELFHVAGVEAGDELNVRSGPSEHHSAVGGIPSDGRKIEIIGECRHDWCPIRHGHVVGWVNSYYLEDEDASREASRDSQ